MFKVWKSIFKISQVKKVKVEKFKCFLYSRLIALLLSSSIVFTAKNIIMEEDNKEISEIRSFGALAQYLPKLAIKSRKKHKKIVFDILEVLKFNIK